MAVRLGSEYLLRTLRLIGEMSEGELLTGLVSTAIVQANIAHIDRPPSPDGAFDSVEAIPPDELRRPISVLALSASLGLPYETTRRHVAKMVSAGLCVRVKGGVIVPVSALGSAGHEAFLAANLANLRRLFRSLKQAGVPLD